jgi:aryl-alcohol dehydrogenase-like predicted oxidoreductase
VLTKLMLGKSGIEISRMGMGLMQWGDISLPANTDHINDAQVIKMFQLALQSGVTFFDTAEVYGNGKSELHLQRCIQTSSADIVIASKFMPFPWRLSKGELRRALMKSLERIGVDHVDLYQMHWPFPPVPIPSWMDAMADVVVDGLVKAVGVSNYSTTQMQIAYDTLSRYKIPLSSNQVKYNLLDRRPETSSLVNLCQQLGVTVIAYSPLEKGILTGKYNLENPPRGLLAWRYNKSFLTKIEQLFTEMRMIGENHNSKTLAMVALNWLMCKGAVPIPGARNLSQEVENFGALGWQLDPGEIARLDELSMQLIRSR